jgi:hypothetical protein
MKPAFNTGDTVLLYSSYVPQGRIKKLSYQWEGPFMILDVFNNGMNYKIQRLNNRKNNFLQLNNNATPKVVNASRLKRYFRRPVPSSRPSPELLL